MTRVPYTGDEKASLVASLDRHRDAILWKLEGLDDDAPRRPMTPSGTRPRGDGNGVVRRHRHAALDADPCPRGHRQARWARRRRAGAHRPLEGGGDPAADGPRLRTLADGYGLTASQRRRLPPLIGAPTRGMADLLEKAARTGEQPWARLFAEGHGEHWAAAADYTERHLGTWRRALLAGPA